MIFGGLQKLTLLDYPQKVACTVFAVGCNFRCPFCHNKGLVCDAQPLLTEQEILAFLQKRKNVLEGVCVTGGEPLLQKDLPQFLAKVKAMGYCIKLDTNGAHPLLLQQLVEQGLVDYVAMDIKNSPDLYSVTSGAQVDLTAIQQSIDFLLQNKVEYEFRTTVTATFHTEQSILSIAKWLDGCKAWHLQQFVDSGELIDATTTGVDNQTLKEWFALAKQINPNTFLRGID